MAKLQIFRLEEPHDIITDPAIKVSVTGNFIEVTFNEKGYAGKTTLVRRFYNSDGLRVAEIRVE